MARTMLDLLALVAVFGALGVYEQMLLRYRRAVDAKTRPSTREMIEDAEWDAVLRMRRPDLDAVIVTGQRFASAVDRNANEARVTGAETAVVAAEE